MATWNSNTTPGKNRRRTAAGGIIAVDDRGKEGSVWMTRQFDEQLKKIRDKEESARKRLHQINTERVERGLRDNRAVRLEERMKTSKQEAELQTEMKILKTENDRLKQQVSALTKSASEKTLAFPEHTGGLEELQLLRRKYFELKENLRRTTKYSKIQLKDKKEKEEEIQKLRYEVKCLEDEIQLRESTLNVLRTRNEHQNNFLTELQQNLLHLTNLSRAREMTTKSMEDKISAVKQISIETQLRQLDELGSLTVEGKQLKQALTALQQQPVAKERHRGEIFQHLFEFVFLVNDKFWSYMLCCAFSSFKTSNR